jgi:CRP-like cAMP-binding protein
MSVSEVVTLISEPKPPLLRGLDTSGLRAVIRAAEEKFFTAGSVMLRQGYPANKLLLLVEGRACYTYSTEEGKRVVVRWTAEGKLLGVATLLSIPRCPYLAITSSTRKLRRIAAC